MPLYRALRGEVVEDAELAVPGPDGLRALLFSGGPITGPDGALLGAYTVARDVTVARAAEARVRASEARLRDVVQAVSDCVFQTDAEGRWTFLNDAWETATGFGVAAALGRPCWEFVHPDDVAAFARALTPLTEGIEEAVRHRHRYLTRTGVVRWAEVRARRAPGGGFVGVMQDVTDEERARRHAEAEQAVVALLDTATELEASSAALLRTLCSHLEWDSAELWRMGADELLHCTAAWVQEELHSFDGRLTGHAFEVGDGMPGQAWAARGPLWVPDLDEDPASAGRELAAAVGLRSGAAVPVRRDGATVAVVLLFSREPREPEPGLMRLFEAVGGHVGRFLERRAAERGVAEHAADLAALSRVTHELAAQTDMLAARLAVCTATREVAHARGVILWEPAAGGAELEVSAAAGLAVRGMRLGLDRPSCAGTVLERRTPLWSGDLTADPRVSERWRSLTGGGACLWVPVLQDGRAVGVLAVVWEQPRQAPPARLHELLRLLAAEVAVTIHRTDLLAQLKESARSDPLTGLANRRVSHEELGRELARAQRHGGAVALAMLDLDHFKAYTDRFGHQAGDQLLKGVSAAWRETLRPTDTLARYGGEEFALLLPHADEDGARATLDRLLELVPLGQSASAGLARWDGAEDADALVARADRALYEAKRAGRNRAVVA